MASKQKKMENLSKSRFLSREEDIELAQSNKKVKDVHLADFNLNNGEGPSSQVRAGSNGSNGLSFKEKLFREIPGAYNQAFELNGRMEEDEDSDDNVVELREGVVAMTLSKEVKQHIIAPQVNSLIVKVASEVGHLMETHRENGYH